MPLALVNTTSLSTNSGNSTPSTPAPRFWTQRRRSPRASIAGVTGPNTTSTSGMISRASPSDDAVMISTSSETS